MERYIAVDNVCAWPNLTRLPGGELVATIFNQPCHGKWEGDVECWASADGRFLLSYGVRNVGLRGIGLRLSEDEGCTWSNPRMLVQYEGTADWGLPGIRSAGRWPHRYGLLLPEHGVASALSHGCADSWRGVY